MTEEPSSDDASVVRLVTVVRTGDLSRTSVVRISTADLTATAGRDYKPRTETLTFGPGVSALDLDVHIMPDEERETIETFLVNLGPQDPVAAVFGPIISAKVSIQDKFGNNASNISNPKSSPYLASLAHFPADLGEQVPSGEPLICLHVSHSFRRSLILIRF